MSNRYFKTSFGFCVGILTFAGPANVGFGATPQAIRAQIAKNYAAMDNAVKDRDIDAIFTYITPGCKFVHSGKTLTADEERSGAEAQLGNADTAESRTKMISFSVKGTTAIVVETQYLRETGLHNGKPLILEQYQRNRDTWVRNENGWQLKQEVVLMDKGFVNGKSLK